MLGVTISFPGLQYFHSRGGGGGGTPYNGLYGEAPTEGVPFSRLQVHESVGISLVTVYENVGKFMASASAAVKRDVNF